VPGEQWRLLSSNPGTVKKLKNQKKKRKTPEDSKEETI
jgi:hypothetical protein